MKFVDNGIPEDFARLTFPGLSVPFCELSDEEFMELVYGIKGYVAKPRRAEGESKITVRPAANKLLLENVDILELSVRADHCLRRAGIQTLGDLCKLSEAELARIRNMGVKSVREVVEKLAQHGLTLHQSCEE